MVLPLAVHPAQARAPLVGVVGVCAVGKSTLVQALRSAGYSVIEIPQEHSELPYLWVRHHPAFLVYLDVSDDVAQQRRKYLTPDRLAQERQLLAFARENAQLTLDVDGLAPQQILASVTAALTAHGITPRPA
ncbi:MAG TPA: hypothetical protein DCM14_06385 [Clostridiales bacterium UBA8153]|nr:hypothetical protein [Clostridiales bacterium UBA8153]